ncbi:MAG TPA: hypothetical protein VGN88_01960 [Phycisphaerae bacterium]|jgi:uncharacterized protein YbaR (Trm112 family)
MSNPVKDNVESAAKTPALVCPLTHASLTQQGDFLVTPDGIKYPIQDGIPILLPTAAILPPGRDSKTSQ